MPTYISVTHNHDKATNEKATDTQKKEQIIRWELPVEIAL